MEWTHDANHIAHMTLYARHAIPPETWSIVAPTTSSERVSYYFHLIVLLLPKDQVIIFYLLLLQLALCFVAVVKSLPVHRMDYIFIRSFEISKDIQSVHILRINVLIT